MNMDMAFVSPGLLTCAGERRQFKRPLKGKGKIYDFYFFLAISIKKNLHSDPNSITGKLYINRQSV